MSFHVASGNDALLVAGDVVANETLSFRRPEWGYGFDVDAAQAAKPASLSWTAAWPTKH